jgi:YVTN family beta-propeller protein
MENWNASIRDSTCICKALAWGQASSPLRLEKTIELRDVQGRIDHLSVDVKGQRLFVSALGNNTVEVIDIKAGKRVKTISGLQEPQGILYVPATDRLYVANAKDGSVRMFDGSSYPLSRPLITAMTPTTFAMMLAAGDRLGILREQLLAVERSVERIKAAQNPGRTTRYASALCEAGGGDDAQIVL